MTQRMIRMLTPLILTLSLAAPSLASPFDAGSRSDAGSSSLGVEELGEPDKAIVVEELTPTEAAGVATDVVNDVRGGNWRHAVAGLLVLVMFGLHKARDRIGWFKGDRGGAILVGVLGFGGALSTWGFSDAPFDWMLMVGAMFTVWTSVGAYTWIKQIISPRDKSSEPELIG